MALSPAVADTAAAALALLLGVDRDEVAARVAEPTGEVREQTVALPPEIGGYLRRQLDFCAGFYGISDYWGDL